jgi:hypothetical protein
VLEVGAGCGLVGIVAARMILRSRRGETRVGGWDEAEERAIVDITDSNDAVLENIARNVVLNDVSSVVRGGRLPGGVREAGPEGDVDGRVGHVLGRRRRPSGGAGCNDGDGRRIGQWDVHDFL